MRGGRVGFAMFFLSIQRKQASCYLKVQVLDLFGMELEFWGMSVGNLGKMKISPKKKKQKQRQQQQKNKKRVALCFSSDNEVVWGWKLGKRHWNLWSMMRGRSQLRNYYLLLLDIHGPFCIITIQLLWEHNERVRVIVRENDESALYRFGLALSGDCSLYIYIYIYI